MLANKTFIDPIVKIMPEDKSKAKMVSFLNDSTFPFTYDIKTTRLGQFLIQSFFILTISRPTLE